MAHSRGGEAIAIAALFNKFIYLLDYPSNVLFNNYHFEIKLSISGTDDGYMPLGRTLQLFDVTMFGIQEFMMEIYDHPGGVKQFMNVRPLMSMEEQQQRIYSKEIIINDFKHYDVTMGSIIGSEIKIRKLFLWSSVNVKVYRSVMLLLQPMENLIGKYTIHLENSINRTSLRFMIGRTADGLIDNLIVRVFYGIGTDDSFVVHVLSALTKRVFKIVSEEYVTAVQTISLPLLHAIISLEFVINGTDAPFLIDNIVIAN